MSYVYFSPSNVAFYPAVWKEDGSYSEAMWPTDAVLLTDDEIDEYWKKSPPAWQQLGVVSGRPAWVDLPAPTHEELVAAAERQQQELIDNAMQSISVIQLKLQVGRKLTAAETEKLNTTLDYIDEVTATDTSTAPDVNWPERPAV